MGYIILIIVLFGGYFIYTKIVVPEQKAKNRKKDELEIFSRDAQRIRYSNNTTNPNMLSVYVPYDKKNALAYKAAENGESVDALINRLIDDELNKLDNGKDIA